QRLIAHLRRLFRRSLEAHRLMAAQTLFDDLIQTLEGAATNEQDVLGIDLNEILVRMFAPTLRWNVRDSALDDLEELLLHTFARDIAGNRRIIGFARDLINFVNVDDATLGARHVKIGDLNQPQQNILDIFTDIARLGERGRIGDTEGDIEDLGQRLRQIGLAAASWANQQDVTLAKLDIIDLHSGIDALVMVIHGDRKSLLSAILANDVLIQLLVDLARSRDFARGDTWLR